MLKGSLQAIFLWTSGHLSSRLTEVCGHQAAVARGLISGSGTSIQGLRSTDASGVWPRLARPVGAGWGTLAAG